MLELRISKTASTLAEEIAYIEDRLWKDGIRLDSDEIAD